MGWASGSGLMDEIIGAAKDYIPSKTARGRFYSRVIRAFEQYDCDTLDECRGQDPEFDALLPKYDDE